MNNQFDELTKSLAQLLTRRTALKKFCLRLAGVALASSITLPTATAASTLGPLVELSQPNPVGGCDDGFRLPGTWTLNDAVEPYAAVNPANPNNIVAAWIMGPIQSVVSAVSLNGGRTWQQVPIPLTLCSGGPYVGAGDPWLSFAPNGDLYALNVAGNSLSAKVAAVNKSTDGGLHWSAPVLVPGAINSFNRGGITADPTDGRFVYAFWQGGLFSRTTDAGSTWEPSRTIIQAPQHYLVNDMIAFVLPDATLVNLCYLIPELHSKPVEMQVTRSIDRGQTWTTPTTAFRIANNDKEWPTTIDPDSGQQPQDPGEPACAMDSRNGNLYAVWEDARFSNFQYNEIAFSMSTDGGRNWSTPIRVNQTPLGIPALNRQAFLPAIGVLRDGTIGVSYYDFRFNDANAGVPTDYWLVQCHPSASASPTDPANWGGELRLTNSSFDLEKCATFPEGVIFIGDYVGNLVGSGNGFVATFTAVNQNNLQSIFARRVGP